MEVPSLYNPDPINGKLVVFLNGEQYTVRANEAIFAECVNAYKEQDWDRFLNSVDPARKIKHLYAKYDQVEVKDGNVYVHGDTVNTTIAQRILQSLSEGLDCTHVFKFVTKTSMNPSARAVNELYTFLEHKDLPITDNGNFLAYKAVREDYTDVHTGKFSNVVGAVLQMPRNKVDDDKEVGCSYGFHAGTLEYASGFKPHNGKMVIVEIDPADVVSIPLDSNCQKLRTCRYKVVGEYTGALTESKYKTHFETDNDPYVEEQWAEDDFSEEEDDEDSFWEDVSNEDWEVQNVSVRSLRSFLFRNRRPAEAMSVSRHFQEIDSTIKFGQLLEFMSESSAYQIYREYTGK